MSVAEQTSDVGGWLQLAVATAGAVQLPTLKWKQASWTLCICIVYALPAGVSDTSNYADVIYRKPNYIH